MSTNCRPGTRRYGIACPHCQSFARVRTSRAVTATYRQLEFVCTNFDCAHVFAAEIAVTHTIRPSLTPNPGVVLRMAPPRRRIDTASALPQPANDEPTRGPEVPPAANDDERMTKRA